MVLRAAFAWPDQPIKLVVPFTPGTGPDIIARFVAERLSARLGQPVVVENVAGASGNIGSQQVARAKPDGQTLMSSVNTLVMNASLYKNLPYDPVADFAPLGLTAWGSLVLVAHPGQKPNTLAELVAAAKAKPKTLTYGSPGVGTPHHLSMALVETASGIELVHVPYKGTAGAVQDLLGGQIGYMFLPVHVSAQHIRAGKLKAIAAGSPAAPAAAARRADPGRKRPEGRRCRHVVRLLRPQGHAGRDRRAAEPGGRGDPRLARSQERLRGAGPHPRHLDAGGAGRDRGARPRALGRCRGQARDPTRVSDVTPTS